MGDDDWGREATRPWSEPEHEEDGKREFLEEMERVVPWGVLVQIVEPHYPKAKTGRPPFGIETMLRIHYLQQWFGLSTR